MPVLSLTGILGNRLPIQDLERLWLESSCYYAVFDENILEDTEWDHLSRELWDRRGELSAYFAFACGLPWKEGRGVEGAEEVNPLKSAMGVDWDKGLPAIVKLGIQTESPKRMTLWKQRLDGLRGWQDRKERLEALHRKNNAKRELRNAKQRAYRRALTSTSPRATT